jgi:hypothetical protein
MAITNPERVGKALELLKAGLGPFIERGFKNAYQAKAAAQAAQFLGEDRLLANKPVAQWDAAALLKLMWEAWNDVFRRTLGPAERSLVSERGITATGGPTRSRSPTTPSSSQPTSPLMTPACSSS